MPICTQRSLPPPPFPGIHIFPPPPSGRRREQPPPLSPVAQPTSLFSHWTRPDKSVRASSSTPPPPTSYGEHATWKRCGIRHFHAELYRDRQFSHLAGCNISTFAQNSVEFHTSSPQTHRHSHPPSSVVLSGGGRGYHVTNCSPAVTALDGGGGGGNDTSSYQLGMNREKENRGGKIARFQTSQEVRQ